MTSNFLRRMLLGTLSHRTLALLRWDLHFIRVRLSHSLSRGPARARTRVRQAKRPVFLNLGSGPRGLEKPSWVNVDGFTERNVDHVIDLARRLPFDDDSFDGIFCEHVIEHFDLEQGKAILGECRRVLRPGGVLRVIVPDGAILMRAYFDAPEMLTSRRRTESGLAMEAINSYFRQRYEHQCTYDFELMRHVLTQTGFNVITQEKYRTGRGPEALRIDDPKYEWESLYVEAAYSRNQDGV
jgi:predicted SAM-dependent methyltransferase